MEVRKDKGRPLIAGVKDSLLPEYRSGSRLCNKQDLTSIARNGDALHST